METQGIGHHARQRLEDLRRMWNNRPMDGEVRAREGSRTNDNGDTVSWSAKATGTGDGVVREHSLTRPDGGTYTRKATIAVDPETGSLQRQVEATRPDGSQVTRDIQFQRTEQGFSRQAATTLADGRQITRDSEVARTEEGLERQVVLTGPNGWNRVKNESLTCDEDARTVQRDVSLYDPQGDLRRQRSIERISIRG